MSKPTKKRTVKERAQRAQTALNALELSCLTNADKERCYQAMDGLVALDEEQTRVKNEVEWLIEDYQNPNARVDPYFDEFTKKLQAILTSMEKTACLERTPKTTRKNPSPPAQE